MLNELDIDLPSLPTDFSILDKLKERIELAKRIESTMHKASKEAHEDNWVRQAAEAMDIEIDSDMEYVSLFLPFVCIGTALTVVRRMSSFSDADETGTKKSRKELKSKAAKVKVLRAELQAMLDKPLMMRGVSAKYITTRGRVGFVDQLVGGTSEFPDLSPILMESDGLNPVFASDHSSLFGIEQSTALADLPKSKKRKAAPLL